MNDEKNYRDAASGEFTTEADAIARPDETVSEPRLPRPKQSKYEMTEEEAATLANQFVYHAQKAIRWSATRLFPELLMSSRKPSWKTRRRLPIEQRRSD